MTDVLDVENGEVQETAQAEAAEDSGPVESPTSSFDVVTTPVVQRNYTRPNPKDPNKPELTIVKQSKDGANFAALEKDGWVMVTENTFTTYEVTSLEGIKDLTPSEAQQVYIYNTGLRTIQTTKIAGIQKAFDKETNTFVNNNESFDLRDAINEPPGRKVTSPILQIKNDVLELASKDAAEARKLIAELMRQLGVV